MNVQPIRDKELVRAISKRLDDKNPKYKIMFLIGIYTGLRISDILSLKIKDISTKIPGTDILKLKNRIKVKEKKTGKIKDIPINQQLQKELSYYINREEIKNSVYLIPSRKSKYIEKPITRQRAYVVLKEVSEEFNIDENIGTHTMRKTFGYHFYKDTADIATLMTILNHSSESITLRYIGIVQEDLNKAYKSINYAR